jgi:hypothetical protein
MSQKAVLNVGGGSKDIPIPPYYSSWRHDLLDIDPRGNPEIVADARELLSQPPAIYDAVYCAHNLEHYHRHDALKVLRGFHHILKPDGFAEIRVPDLMGVIRTVALRGLDIDDVLYQSQRGPILVRDVIYGYHVEIEQSNNDYYAHKTGFSPASLARAASACGFKVWASGVIEFELFSYLFKEQPGDDLQLMLGLRR